ncbi:hypothetical protein ACOSQ2_032353 [Xanthoceras sorbifolium]
MILCHFLSTNSMETTKFLASPTFLMMIRNQELLQPMFHILPWRSPSRSLKMLRLKREKV